jgi:SRSO17 transposase
MSQHQYRLSLLAIQQTKFYITLISRSRYRTLLARAFRAPAYLSNSKKPRSKPEIALAEIDRAMAAGVQFSCVLADAGYGLSAPFRRRLAWAAASLVTSRCSRSTSS